MSTNETVIKASPERVWEVLADGWTYPLWVVGASRMRAVEESWPEVGARLHHSVGTWPVLIDDYTEVTAADPGVSLTLRARAQPSGIASVRLSLEPHGSDTRVVMEEDVVSGPGALMPKPARDAALSWRNSESLRRLAYVAERPVATDSD
ncbi:SRPBCC family protein [Nocardioides sp. dk4132]|uniref:SRPBCC family protein n=1 Tax=unclassified Nocardioides TaxID=2615069 RepID=UPI001295B130|nr:MULTISPECIES: SRPBCC family protein [unclassified Nocardioides]MQW75324.1 SRPBCC family protein [Nocardioides sp. dk4132]QGA07527.1 SRPBCC family protein [Nocardioides sp. dk884]